MSQLLVIDGVSVRRDIFGRYCLNDLHRAAGAQDKHKPAFWLRNEQTEQLISELQISNSETPDPVSVIRGGKEQGSYVCKELVYSYAMWISPQFSLRVIRTFDAAVNQPPNLQSQAADKMQAGVILLDFMQRSLNLSNSSVLGACQKLQDAVGLPNLAPQYAIDAPAGAPDGSSRPTQSLSALLKANGIRMSATLAYQQLAKLGIVEHKERRSRSGVNGVKRFWAMTAKGCMYGKNITSPANPRETQPHFFESKFQELLRLLETVH
ncbi:MULTISPECIES: KilA-N domain-containing protein [Enterobacteriaceae]|uniref:KilA-N domain-containing protein n=1 Tax=Enterobacteriaceae TaxID=543 RepID=UPI000F7BC63E|nr:MULTISPECIES: KilA-N domain-containing protein [Enterobacteriaceae]AZP32573.1 DNA-binding protein [Cronobacter sakazakii]QBF86542.1 KilA-N domain-containing protein [Leclercia adecarboxylata]